MGTTAENFNDVALLVGELHQAAAKGDCRAVEDLLRKNVDVNAADKDGNTAIIFAVEKGDEETIAKLIEKGANVDHKNVSGVSARALTQAKQDQRLTRAVDAAISDRAYNELLEAIRKDDLPKAQEILEAGAIADINVGPGGRVGAALFQAICDDRLEFVNLFLKSGAKADQPFHDGDMPLIYAILKWHNNALIVAKLLEYGAKPNMPARDGKLALVEAADKGDETITHMLLDHDADPNIGGGRETAAHRAVKEGNTEIIRLLRARGANLDLLNSSEQTPLEFAILSRRRAAADVLLEEGADPRIKGKNGITTLMDAAWAGESGLIPELLRRGVEIDAQKDDDKYTALMWAAFKGKRDAARVLLELGADYNLKNADGKTALDIAREKGHLHVVELITNKVGAEVKEGLKEPTTIKKPLRFVIGEKRDHH